jgi:hypothetical protein
MHSIVLISNNVPKEKPHGERWITLSDRLIYHICKNYLIIGGIFWFMGDMAE